MILAGDFCKCLFFVLRKISPIASFLLFLPWNGVKFCHMHQLIRLCGSFYTLLCPPNVLLHCWTIIQDSRNIVTLNSWDKSRLLEYIIILICYWMFSSILLRIGYMNFIHCQTSIQDFLGCLILEAFLSKK